MGQRERGYTSCSPVRLEHHRRTVGPREPPTGDTRCSDVRSPRDLRSWHGVRVLDLGHAHRRAVLRGPARRAGRGGHQDRAAARRRLHARDRSVRRQRDGRTRCSGRSKGAAARASRSTCARPKARTCSGASRRPPTWSSRTSGPGTLEQWNIGPTASRPATRDGAHLDVRPGRPVLERGPASIASASATAGCCTSPAIPTARRCASASRSPTTSPACSRRRPRSSALYARDARGRQRRRDRRRALRRRAAHPRVDAGRVRPARHRAHARRQSARELGAARQLPDPRRQVRVHRRRLRRELRAPVQGDGPARPRSTIRASPSSPTAPRTATRSTASSPSGPPRSTRRDIEERCVAHDVPVATAYTAADIFADPHIAARGRPRHRRRSGDRSDPSTGAVPARRRRPNRSRRPARRARRAHRRGAAVRSALSTAELDDAARRRASCDATRAIPKACSSCTTTARSRSIGGYSPTSGRYHFPLLDTCPYSGATDVERVVLSRDGDVVGAGPRSPRRRPATRARCRTASASSSSSHEQLRIITRLRESDPARLTFGQPMTLVADELPGGVVTWAFA